MTSFGGTVVEVRFFSPGMAASGALVLAVELPDGQELNVHLGPAWFVSVQGMTFQIGDHVTVLGSRVTYQMQKIVVAAEITKGMSTIRLRDLDGVPLWRVARPSS